jgi:hypothetical protein
VQLFDLGARRRVDDAADCFFERGVERDRGRRRRAGRAFEELRAREQEFAVEFEDFVKLGGYVGPDDVFDAYSGGLEFAGLDGGLDVWEERCVGGGEVPREVVPFRVVVVWLSHCLSVGPFGVAIWIA